MTRCSIHLLEKIIISQSSDVLPGMTKKESSNEKEFDSVKMMRDIRDKISKDIEGMNLEEEKRYLQKMISSSK